MIIQIVDYFVQTRRSTSITIFLRQIEIICGALAAGSRVLSLWISTAVTMDRWILICYPVYGKTICTLNRAKIVSRTLFVITFLYSIPLIFEYEVVQMPSVYQMINVDNESTLLTDQKFLNKNSMLVTKGYSDLAKRRIYRWAYMFFNVIFVYTVPTLSIFFFNVQLIRALHRLRSRTKRLSEKNRSIQSENSCPQNRRRSQHSKYSVTIMVIAMVLLLLFCRSPTIVLWILWSFELTIKIFFDSSSSSTIRRFHHIANLIAIINAATNFIPFCVFGQLFRTECLSIYCCKKPSSEQLAHQAKRKYVEKCQQLKRNSRITIVNEQQTTQIIKDHLQTIPSLNSDSPSTNERRQSTNILRLSDPPLNGNGHLQQQKRVAFNATPFINETAHL
jgi:hypothetical protein